MGQRARTVTLLVGFLVLGLVPVVAALANEPFYLDLFRRIMIFAIAAVSLDLILGFGGMVSFGHAAYLGIGAYAVAIPAFYGVHSGAVQWALAVVLSGLIALAIGAVSLRTSGVSFIMITLAFAQMLYYLGISIDAWGADDGMRLARRSDFGGVVDLTNAYVFYYVVFALLVLLLGLGRRLIDARFGLVIRSAKSNEPRMRAIGHAELHALDAVRRHHGDGDSRRHGHAVRTGARGGRVPAPRGHPLGVDGALAGRPGSVARADRPLCAPRSVRPAAGRDVTQWLSRC
jgi:ABC-type branched-subunit amino acid transport system permease subunit